MNVATDAPAASHGLKEFVISHAYRPWPKQTLFHESSARFRLQVGSYGSGKSRPLLWEALFNAIEFPGSNSILLRKTMPDLKRTVIDKFESDVPEEMYASYHQTDHIVYFHPVKVDVRDSVTGEYILDPATGQRMQEVVQSKLYFGACEKETDVGKYLSTEFVYIGFEELGEFPFAIWDALEGRNRCPIFGARACMAAATNPMGIGWGWIKRMWVDHLPARGMDEDKFDASQYEYFHSTVDDNPIYAKDKEYIQTLEKSPLRDKIRWGKLDTVSGNYFDNFEPLRHVRPASDFIFQAWQPVWIGWDYGFGHYACITFWTKAILKPRWEGAAPKVVNVCIREIILEENTPEEQTAALIASIPRLKNPDGTDGGYAESIESIHFSWERFNRTVSNRTVADEITELLMAAGLPGVTRSNTDRVAGWTKLYSLLDSDDIFFLKADGFHRGCPILAESLPLLVRGDGIKVSLEDVVKPPGKSLEDDIGDSCRMAIAGVLLDEGEKPRDVKLREKLAGISDPMRRHVEQYKDYIEQTRPRPKQAGRIVPSWTKRVQ